MSTVPPPPPSRPPAPQGGANFGPARTNKLAGWSLGLSLCGVFCLITAVLGIVFGFIAQSQIKQSGEAGKGMALAGIIIGFVLVIPSFLIFSALFLNSN